MSARSALHLKILTELKFLYSFLIVRCWCSALPKRTLSKTLTARKNQDDVLWRYSTRPIRQPLLKKLVGKEYLAECACNCFMYILFNSTCRLQQATWIIVDKTLAPWRHLLLWSVTCYQLIVAMCVRLHACQQCVNCWAATLPEINI